MKLIDRVDLFKALCKNIDDPDLLAYLSDIIETVSIVDETLNGKWFNTPAFHTWKCSICSNTSHTRHRYCPRCGSRMEISK